MDYTVPNPEHRVTIPTDSYLVKGSEESFAQGQDQNRQIIEYAKSLGLEDRYVSVEVFYKSNFGPAHSTSEENYDAVVVDTEEGKIIETLPPYDEIDPDWQSKREAQDG